MSALKAPIRSLGHSKKLKPCPRATQCPFLQHRSFKSSTAARSPDLQSEQPNPPPPPPAQTSPIIPSSLQSLHNASAEEQTLGSRRRRQALKTSQNIPFEQLPYQCFQEARKVLRDDREEKLEQIKLQQERIARLQGHTVEDAQRAQHEHRIKSMVRHIERLKILADINDPSVKRTFEDGRGDMNKPIYRHLAERKWRAQKRLIVMQRVQQMFVTPDVLAKVEPTMDVSLSFGQKTIQPGVFVPSRLSSAPATLKIQPFDKGERLVTIVVVDADVPNVDTDGFENRCHYLAANIPVSPTNTIVSLALESSKKDEQLVLDWLPPFAQKGSPYHRLGIFVLEQKNNKPIDVKTLSTHETDTSVQRDGFSLRKFVSAHQLTAVGVHMFRTQWDEGTADVMNTFGIPGADVQLVRKKIPKLPYKKKDGARYR